MEEVRPAISDNAPGTARGGDALRFLRVPGGGWFVDLWPVVGLDDTRLMKRAHGRSEP